MTTKQRIQKVLANAGLGSRRAIEQWIRDGRIIVNGAPAQLGDRINEEDHVKVDGRSVSNKRLQQDAHHIIIYNKPEGEIVTRRDDSGRPTVFHNMPILAKGRWIAVGRLDINSSGLLILTTHGELANRLMHPSTQIEREYAVRVHGRVSEAMLQQLVNGVELDDGPARFEDIVESGGEGSNRWYHVVIMEGRKREIRRMWEAVGAWVNRLKRVRFGPVILDSSVKVGQWRSLKQEESRDLLEMAGLKGVTIAPIEYRQSRRERR
jgi:23S rRNA pseudouridine2605 synthase